MKCSTVYREVQNGSYIWTVWMDEERNKNSMRIHSQSMGRTIYETDDIWDSDMLKIVRILKRNQYSYLKIGDVLKKINRECRHLEIPTYIH